MPPSDFYPDLQKMSRGLASGGILEGWQSRQKLQKAPVKITATARTVFTAYNGSKEHTKKAVRTCSGG
jgi:hypothetical protein